MPRGLLSAGLFDKKHTNCSIEMEAFSLTSRCVCRKTETLIGVTNIINTKLGAANTAGNTTAAIADG